MAKIVILGAGVMGSALAVPAADNGHEVILAATPLDQEILAALRQDRSAHPRLGAPIPPSVQPVDADDLTQADVEAADLVVVGVSTPGMPWAVDQLARLRPQKAIALVTKGLVEDGGAAPLTFADAVPKMLRERGFADQTPLIGIGGPCIARELAERRPTRVVFASADRAAAQNAAAMLAAPYYRVSLSDDTAGVEACAALKNFFTIGVSAMLGQHKRNDVPMKNPVAAAFQQAVDEMAVLSPWLGGTRDAAFGLAGLGDLHVTVGGGRNSRLGKLLGEGLSLFEAMNGPLVGETVEGVDVGRVLRRYLLDGAPGLDTAKLPLATALVTAIAAGEGLQFDAAA